jgi:hypothetical protein
MPPSPKLAKFPPKSAGLPPFPSWMICECRQRPASDPRSVHEWPARSHVTSVVGGGGGRDLFKYSSINGYFKKLLLQNRSAKLAPTLLQCQSLPTSSPWALRSEYPAYVVIRTYIIERRRPFFLSRRHYILQNISAEDSEHQEQSRPQRTRGTVSSLLFSR